jgi:hypothetical protein
MAVRREYRAGDLVRLRGEGHLEVDTPTGLHLRIPVDRRGRVELWTPVPGTYRLRWFDGTEEELQVGEARPPEVLTCALSVAPGQPPAGYPLGQALRLEARFTDLQGRPARPGLTFTAQSPAEGAPARGLLAEAQGDCYVAVLTPDCYGPWTVRVAGGGAAAEMGLYVARPA